MDHLTSEIVLFLKEEQHIEEETKNLFPTVETTITAKRQAADHSNKGRANDLKAIQEYQSGSYRRLFIYLDN